jgi:hypothetical protein
MEWILPPSLVLQKLDWIKNNLLKDALSMQNSNQY